MLLSGLVSQSDWVSLNNQYTFTFMTGRWFEYRADDWVFVNLRDRLTSWGVVLSVTRPFLSDHLVVIIKPTMEMTLADWMGAFDYALRDMGYNSYSFLTAETGTISSSPGGIYEVSKGIEKTIEGTVGTAVITTLKPMYPYILGAITVYAAITMLPGLMKKR